MATETSGTWACPACGQPVPEKCDGRCNTGTTAERTTSK